MKICCYLCILFLINCIVSLVKESYEVTYVSNEEIYLENILNSTVILFCVSLNNKIFSKIKSIKISQIKNFFNNEIQQLYGKYKWFTDQYKKISHKMEDCIIFKNNLCFKIFKENDFANFKNLFNIFDIEFYIYNNDTYDFLSIEPEDIYSAKEFISLDKFHLFVILKKEYPYSSCLNNYRKFICLNDCFKKKNRLSKYYYAKNETEPIHFKDDGKNLLSIQTDENECFKRCKMESCKSVYFFSKKKKSLNSVFIKALVLMSIFELWSQLIGLICLFYNFSFCQIYTKISSSISLKIRDNTIKIKKLKKAAKYFYSLKIVLMIFISFLISTGLLYNVIADYRMKNPIIKEITSTLLVLEPLTLIFCMPFTENKKFNYTQYYKNKAVLAMEKETNDFVKNLETIYLEFQNKKQTIIYNFETKVYFKKRYNIVDNRMSRCFKISLFLKDIPKYQSLFLNAKLIVKLKFNQDYELYLLSECQDFTTSSFKYNLEYDFLKKYSKISLLTKRKIKCVDYREKYSYCQSQSSCVDFCIQTEFYRTYQNLSLYSIIDKDFFTKDQWSTVYINDDKGTYEKIKENCTKLFNTSDCEMSIFEKSIPNSNLISRDDLFIPLDLNYEILSTLEEKTFFWYKLAMDILNLQSILFGMNVLKLFSLIFYFFRLRNRKFIYYTVNVFCGLGFLLHSFFILYQVIKNELVSSQFYEYSDQLVAPDFLFCFEIDKSLIDENHLLTGNYLNKITKDLNEKNIFNKIEYLDESNEWIQLNEENKFGTKQFKIDAFYFSDKKCIKFRPEITYLRERFHFNNKKTILKVYFDLFFVSRYKKIHFYSIVKNTKQFSKPVILDFVRIFNKDFKISQSIDQELYKIDYNDKFNLIKNPLSLLYSESNNVYDVDSYLNNLIRNYKKSINYSTLSLPLESHHFDKIIDDELFDQFYYQIQNISDYSSTPNPNYKRSFALNSYSVLKVENHEPCFTFSINFFKKTLYITNEDNYVKLVLNLLNTLSLWLDHSPLDLFVYFYKLITYLTYNYTILLKTLQTISINDGAFK